MSSCVSQATADAILRRVSGLTTANLDIAVSSRASQASVDALATGLQALGLDGLGAHLDLLLRAKIEVALASGDARVVLFYAPASAGGTWRRSGRSWPTPSRWPARSGVDVGKAERSLAGGDLAYAAGRYVEAYDRFRRAYQELD